MKTLLRFLCFLCLGAVLFAGLSNTCAFAEQTVLDAPDTSKTVDSIQVHEMPKKTMYVIGETFSAEGGVLKINYTDGTAALLPMTDGSVKLSNPTMNTANTKNVTATYEKKRVVFKIEVAGSMCDVTFDDHYEGAPEATVQQVSMDAQVAAPQPPVRDGYTFVDWFANADYTAAYDFTSPVTDHITLYALWQKDGASYVSVTFDYDYYGAKLSRYTYPVESGMTVSQPNVPPERTGYTFSKWVDENGNDFDFAQPLTADTTIKAQWVKALEGEQTWVFEAEDTDLSGKIGPSFSGSAQETSMIIFNDQIEASGNRVVGYLYDSGVSLEFYIASDVDVDDATLTVRIAGEYATMTYNSNDYQVLVGGEAMNYAPVTIDIASQGDTALCADRIVIPNISLSKGENLIRLVTNNTNAISGTTFKANAPMVDCIKITTSAVLTWDENHGEPATGNYKN